MFLVLTGLKSKLSWLRLRVCELVWGVILECFEEASMSHKLD